MLSTGMEVLHSSNAMFAETMAERPLLVTVRFVTDLRSALSNWQKSFSCVLPGRMKWGVPTKMMATVYDQVKKVVAKVLLNEDFDYLSENAPVNNSRD
jgi:hypothetical protein